MGDVRLSMRSAAGGGAALRQEGERLRKTKDLVGSEEVAAKLRAISPKTIDRVLARGKRGRRLRRDRNASVPPLLEQPRPGANREPGRAPVVEEEDPGKGGLGVGPGGGGQPAGGLCVALRPLDARG